MIIHIKNQSGLTISVLTVKNLVFIFMRLLLQLTLLILLIRSFSPFGIKAIKIIVRAFI